MIVHRPITRVGRAMYNRRHDCRARRRPRGLRVEGSAQADARRARRRAGATSAPPRPRSVDYPDYAAPVAHAVADGEADRGILVCGSGVGMAIAANKVPGIRAAPIRRRRRRAALAREHNDLNVLTLGGRQRRRRPTPRRSSTRSSTRRSPAAATSARSARSAARTRRRAPTSPRLMPSRRPTP